jgi:hypothetical protein
MWEYSAVTTVTELLDVLCYIHPLTLPNKFQVYKCLLISFGVEMWGRTIEDTGLP